MTFPSCSRARSPFDAVVHEWGELLHRPVERYGHARPFLLHRRHCLSVSSPHPFAQFPVVLDSLGRKGEGKIFDDESQDKPVQPISLEIITKDCCLCV